MAENKKSFLLYCDWIELFEDLPDDVCGKLIKHIFRYVNDLSPETDDQVIKSSFILIKQQLKRDLRKYEGIVERNRLNGSKGGRPTNPKEPKEPSGLSGNPSKPKKPDIDKDTVIDKDKDIKDLIDQKTYRDNYLEWIKFRSEMKLKKLTLTGVKKQLKFLDEQPDPTECIEQSIRNSYQGLFEVKNNGQNKRGNGTTTFDEYKAIRNDIAEEFKGN